MWRTATCFIIFGVFVYVKGYEEMIGRGVWTVLNVQTCDNPEQYKAQLNISRNKINRTHDCFNMGMQFDQEINVYNHALKIDVYKQVDGGFKPFQTINEDSFCKYVRKYAKDNFVKILTRAGLQKPDCPIPADSYFAKDFVFDYTELPEKCMYGVYKGHAYLVRGGLSVACISILCECKKIEDDEYED